MRIAELNGEMIYFHLDYEDNRLGPPTTNLNLHAATGIVQCTRFDVNLSKESIRSMESRVFSIRESAVSIPFELMSVFSVANGNMKFSLKPAVSCN